MELVLQFIRIRFDMRNFYDVIVIIQGLKRIRVEISGVKDFDEVI